MTVALEQSPKERARSVSRSGQDFRGNERVRRGAFDPSETLQPAHEIARLELDVDVSATLPSRDLIRRETKLPAHENSSPFHDLDIHAANRDDETPPSTGATVCHVQPEELGEFGVHVRRHPNPRRIGMLRSKRRQ